MSYRDSPTREWWGSSAKCPTSVVMKTKEVIPPMSRSPGWKYLWSIGIGSWILHFIGCVLQAICGNISRRRFSIIIININLFDKVYLIATKFSRILKIGRGWTKSLCSSHKHNLRMQMALKKTYWLFYLSLQFLIICLSISTLS